jgi:multiple sugar transport system substrate-binding protein
MVSRRGVLGLAAGAMLAACSQRDKDRLSWWALGTAGENAPVLLPPFERQVGIGVDVQAIPYTGAHEKLLTGFAGRSLPDVMMVSSMWLPELALIGALVPPPARSPLLTDQLEGPLASVTVDGRAVAVPWTANAWMQFYRRDLLAEVGYNAPPPDWAEWTRMAAKLKRRHPDRYATLHLIDWPEPLFAYAAQQPEPLLREHGTRGNFSTPGFRAALGFYKSIYDQGLSPIVSGAEAGDNYINFQRGWMAILPSDAVTIGDLRRRTAMIPRASWGAVATPSSSGATIAMAQGASLAVSRDAADPEAAWRLVEYLGGARTQQHLYSITGDLPTRRDAWTAPRLADDPVAQLFSEQIARSVAPPAVPEWQRIVTEVQVVAEHMVRGEYSVDAATVQMDRRVDRILQKRRWLLDKGRVA